MFPGLIARPLRVVAVLIVLLAIGAGLWLWDRAGASTPVGEDAAVRAYREGGGPADGAPATPGIPRPGVYSFRQSGTERGGAGPVGVSRSLPDRAPYVVTLAPGGYAQELDISEEHIEGVRVRVGPAGAREVSRRTKVTFLGVGRDDRRDLRPPPLRTPRPLTVGRTWSGRYTAGDLPVEFHSSVLRSEVVVIDGRRVAARVVRTVGDTGGVHPGRRIDVIWWSPALSLPLRWDIDMRIGGPVTLRTTAPLELESLEPRR